MSHRENKDMTYNKLSGSKNLNLSWLIRISASLISQGDWETTIKLLVQINLVPEPLEFVKHIGVDKYEGSMVIR